MSQTQTQTQAQMLLADAFDDAFDDDDEFDDGIDIDELDTDEDPAPSKKCWLIVASKGGIMMTTHISQDYLDFKATCAQMQAKGMSVKHREAPRLSVAWEWEANLSIPEVAIWAHYQEGVPANVAQ